MLKHSPFKLFMGLSLLIVCLQASAAKLAIVIDDFGYRVKEDNQILALPIPITIAILPSSPHGREVAEKAHQQGREILIHMPMKPLSKQPLEKNTLAPSMSAEEIDRIIKNAISRVPYAKGMNNHMGSEMTSSLPGMRNVMRSLSQSNLFFLDSVTIGNTQAVNAAKEFGVPTTKRNIFIDNNQSEDETRVQLNKAVAYARKHGSAVAIGHPHPSTVRALQKYLPQLPADVELIAVSALVGQPSSNSSQPTKPLRMQPEEVKKEAQQPKMIDSQKPAEQMPNPNEVEAVQPIEIGVCEFEQPQTRREGIHFLMFVVESICQDKALQPLLVNELPKKKQSLFAK
ncbi:divergent polysaccharide deacetylase family protein [Providencia sp.]|uniref:divergent polysaccharide deacetylase family protein n=1 Tax=Providencia sp. TaxID=589 RepID=UPI001B7B2DF2|nr:divergent polysaccharide deacetylase family protein [Providencia sp.]MBP6123951.1 divergent polysaccharide deacetylase family protein [Providencia sp.]